MLLTCALSFPQKKKQPLGDGAIRLCDLPAELLDQGVHHKVDGPGQLRADARDEQGCTARARVLQQGLVGRALPPSDLMVNAQC